MPVPRILDILEDLGGKKYSSTLEISKGYHQDFTHDPTFQIPPWDFMSDSGSRSVCSQSTFTYSKLTTGPLEQGMKYVQS